MQAKNKYQTKEAMSHSENKFPSKIGIFNICGLGDRLLLRPAIQEIKRLSPKTKIYLLDCDDSLKSLHENDKNLHGYSVMPDYSIFKNNFGYDDKIIFYNLSGFIRMTGCRQHWMNIALRIFNIDNRDLKPEIRLSGRDENFGRSYAKSFKNRMIVLCNESSENIKRWDNKRWERVINKCKGYVFVQVGKKDSLPIKGAVNMLGRTTVTQAMSLVKYSRLVATIDGFFNHIANIFDVPRVILWGNGDPRIFGYSKNTVNIWKRLPCGSCVFSTRDIKQERLCLKKERVPPCMLAIKEFEVINAIKMMLREKYDPSIKYYKLRPSGKDICQNCKHKGICNLDSFKLRISDLFLLHYLK